MTFAPEKDGAYIAAGNFYGVIPFEGRYDALLPTGFYFDKVKNSFVTQFNIEEVDGEARDAKWINYKDGKVLVIARNNKSLVFFK